MFNNTFFLMLLFVGSGALFSNVQNQNSIYCKMLEVYHPPFEHTINYYTFEIFIESSPGWLKLIPYGCLK